MTPLESRVFEVEVEDIWFVPQDELDSYRHQVDVDASRLKDTDYAATANDIAKSIGERLVLTRRGPEYEPNRAVASVGIH